MTTKLTLVLLFIVTMISLSMELPAEIPKRKREPNLYNVISALHNLEEAAKETKKEFFAKYMRLNDAAEQEGNDVDKRSCIEVGHEGCEGNDGKCCRGGGDAYTGDLRKCVNLGSFSTPKYVCQEA